MRTQAFALEHGAKVWDRGAVMEPAYDWHISTKVRVSADKRRVFNALIEPEYLELWVRLPSQDQAGHIVASRARNLFRFDYIQSGNLALTVLGSYRYCSQRGISFDWWNTSCNSVSSCVEIHLERCRECSILSLTHRGIFEKKEYLWQKEMWEGSLARLQGLFS
ncbi:MAG: hypothetical protein WBY53_04965 [Acidobacteriaceae bacterium]